MVTGKEFEREERNQLWRSESAAAGVCRLCRRRKEIRERVDVEGETQQVMHIDEVDGHMLSPSTESWTSSRLCSAAAPDVESVVPCRCEYRRIHIDTFGDSVMENVHSHW